MFPCSTCGKRVPLERALLNQDLTANMVGFCSFACQNVGYDRLFNATPPPTKAMVARLGGTSLNPRGMTAFDLARSAL